jgi:hypothetical protein
MARRLTWILLIAVLAGAVAPAAAPARAGGPLTRATGAWFGAFVNNTRATSVSGIEEDRFYTWGQQIPTDMQRWDEDDGVQRRHRRDNPVRFPIEGDPGRCRLAHRRKLPERRRLVCHYRSDGRSLLMLVLFSDIGEHGAPTRIRVGSHLDVPAVLPPYGVEGKPRFPRVGSAQRPSAPFRSGDRAWPGAYSLCHPFFVHAADRHRGQSPRFMGQPPPLLEHGSDP